MAIVLYGARMASTFGLLAALAWLIWEQLPEHRRAIPLEELPCAELLPEFDVRIERLDDLFVAYRKADGTLYALHDHFVFVSLDGGESFERRGALPKRPGVFTAAKNYLARTKLVRSIRRTSHPGNLVALPSGTLLVFYDRIYRSTDDGWSFTPVFDYEEEAAHSPFGGNEGVAVTPDGTVFFGEYFGQRARASRIFRGTDDGTKWAAIHEFSPGEILHVHSVEYDPYRDRLWVLTGDRDAEAHLYWSDPQDWRLEEVGGGSQDWRIVSLIVREQDLIWGSDDDRDGAAIFRWSLQDRELERLQDIGKVSYHSTRLASGEVAVSTTFEPRSRFVVEHRPRRATEIWFSREGDRWSRVFSLPGREEVEATGRRPSLAFPAGTPGEHLYAYAHETACEDGNTLRLTIN